MKNYILTAAALAAFALTSCLDSGEQFKPEGEANVAIGIVLPSAGTRAIGSPITGDDEIAELRNGHVFLYNSSTRLIDKHVTLYAEDRPDFGHMQVTFDEITNSMGEGGDELDDLVVVLNVLSQTDRCLVVLNAFDDEGNDLITALQTDIDEVMELTADANSLNYGTEKNIDYVPLVEDGAIDYQKSGTQGGATNNVAYAGTADVTVEAIGTRVQIGQFTATEATDGTTLEYTVDGIFINYYIPTMYLWGDNEDTLVDNGEDGDDYNATTYEDYPSLYDLTGWTTNEAVTAPSDAGKYWVYNLVPTGGVPHIIVKLGVKRYQGETAIDATPIERWLTIRKYMEGSEEVPAFAANHMYTLSDVQFSYEDTTEDPYGENQNVVVHVNVTPWENHPVTWNKD
jgi:hypothetical protein